MTGGLVSGYEGVKMVFQGLTSPQQSGSKRVKAVSAAVVAVALSAIIVGIASASGRTPAVAASSPPATVTATALPKSSSPPFKPVGTIVSAASVGNSSNLGPVPRVFVGSQDGVSMGTSRSLGGVTYPVATVNGGKTWRIDGPELHVQAANAPNVVTQVGAASPATYFIYGGPMGANSVNVTTNGGKQWYRAYLGGVVDAVAATNSEDLYAFIGAPGAYYSNNGGRTWHYNTSLP
jgi:hypothetical protein